MGTSSGLRKGGVCTDAPVDPACVSCIAAIARRHRLTVGNPRGDRDESRARSRTNRRVRRRCGEGTIPGFVLHRKPRWHAVYPDEPKACRFRDPISRSVVRVRVCITSNAEAGPRSLVPVCVLFDQMAGRFPARHRRCRFSCTTHGRAQPVYKPGPPVRWVSSCPDQARKPGTRALFLALRRASSMV